jgi:hypothetical protein
MRTNLKAILAAIGAAALLGSPAMARTHHSHAPSAEGIGGAHGAAYQAPYYMPGNEGGPYTPSMPTPAHGQSHDFQDDTRGG